MAEAENVIKIQLLRPLFAIEIGSESVGLLDREF